MLKIILGYKEFITEVESCYFKFCPRSRVISFLCLSLLQVRSEEKQESVPPKAFGVSRRDVTLSLPTATVAALTLFSVEPAEARIVKPEIRRRIQEKLEMLREKAGVSKPKTNDGKEPSPSSEDETLLSSPSAPLPSPQESPIVPPVEALLP